MEFNEGNTKFDLIVKNWKEAIIESGLILEKLGFANENYKYNIIKDVEKYGSYVMISPYIVIPHTRPENGALNVGCCLTTVKNEVYFDDNKKYPIKVLIAFTAVDDKQHLEMLKDIVRIIEVGLLDKLDEFQEMNSKEKLYYLNSIIKEEVKE